MKRSCVVDIKMDLNRRGCDVIDSVQPSQNTSQWRPLVNTVLNRQIPQTLNKHSIKGKARPKTGHYGSEGE